MESFTSIDDVLGCVKQALDSSLKEGTTKKVSTLYACNASGKTRLSKLFYDQFKGNAL